MWTVRRSTKSQKGSHTATQLPSPMQIVLVVQRGLPGERCPVAFWEDVGSIKEWEGVHWQPGLWTPAPAYTLLHHRLSQP